jgi:hypothetical protein
VTDIQIMIAFIAGGFALVLGAGWVLRNDPRFNPPEDTP